MTTTPPSPSRIALFRGKQIRRTLRDGEWWFSVVDVIEALIDSAKPSVYWSAMKARVHDDDGIQLSTICKQLKLESSDGKKYETDCANTEGIFRIIQSIPSPKAEPFKRWLAKVGYERVQEIENPELATKRTRMLYKLKGYSDDWIEKRMRGIAIREELTEEWLERGVKEGREYAILTGEISKATFGMTPSEYKKYKGLRGEKETATFPPSIACPKYFSSHPLLSHPLHTQRPRCRHRRTWVPVSRCMYCPWKHTTKQYWHGKCTCPLYVPAPTRFCGILGMP